MWIPVLVGRMAFRAGTARRLSGGFNDVMLVGAFLTGSEDLYL